MFPLHPLANPVIVIDRDMLTFPSRTMFQCFLKIYQWVPQLLDRQSPYRYMHRDRERERREREREIYIYMIIYIPMHNLENPIINLPFGDDMYHSCMVILGLFIIRQVYQIS